MSNTVTPEAVKPFDHVGFIIAYENGETTREETIAGFQELINSGLVWKLQGNYGRAAVNFIENGYCTRP